MKAIKNDRASYKTRAAIGCPKPIIDAKSATVARTGHFVVDRNGYFVWSKSPKAGSGESR